MIFNQTDLRKRVSGAKFDAESEFEVRLTVAPPKSIKNDAQINQKTLPGPPWASQGHLKETEIVYNVHL